MANRSSSGGGSGWASPDRTVVWTEPKKKKVASVAVVYYLCRQDGQLEHPHFVHVPCLSDPPRLYLRDVLARLSDLRGAAMPASYSWSAKTTYRNAGYVWHDLTADDLILPAQGNHEYVLKGSPLLLLRPTATDHLQLPAASTKRSHHNRWTSFDLADYNRSGAPAAELIGIDEISPPPCSSSPDSSRQLQQDGTPQSAAAAAGLSRMRASAMLMQLISCGSIKNAVPPRRKGSSS
ncbi:protein SOSEKI 2-like, partial [Oryza brachyantha]